MHLGRWWISAEVPYNPPGNILSLGHAPWAAVPGRGGQACVDNASVRTEFPQENKGWGGERFSCITDFSKGWSIWPFFSPFFLEKVMNMGIYGWQQIPHFSDILRCLQSVILKSQFCRVQHFCDVWYEMLEKSVQYWTPNLLYDPDVGCTYAIYPR